MNLRRQTTFPDQSSQFYRSSSRIFARQEATFPSSSSISTGAVKNRNRKPFFASRRAIGASLFWFDTENFSDSLTRPRTVFASRSFGLSDIFVIFPQHPTPTVKKRPFLARFFGIVLHFTPIFVQSKKIFVRLLLFESS